MAPQGALEQPRDGRLGKAGGRLVAVWTSTAGRLECALTNSPYQLPRQFSRRLTERTQLSDSALPNETGKEHKRHKEVTRSTRI
jgi:hypothetical protein